MFEKSECRGVDAAGYWGTEKGIDGNVLYHKEPGKSSEFVKNEAWKLVRKHNPNLLLVHARGASKSFGEPSVNYNNHPFTSFDKSIGLIHNGRIDDCEYHSLKIKYELQTQCDSEILLRIFESGESYSSEELKDDFGGLEHSKRLAGIRDVFSLINEGHMAVAVGERGEFGKRMLWLFRNRHRPLWIIDVREPLGQVFFVSELSIWEEAVRECTDTKSLTRNQKLIELPTEEIWQFTITPEKSYPKNVERFEVCKSDFTPWLFDGKKHISTRQPASFEVITGLDSEDQIIQKKQNQKHCKIDVDTEEFPISEVERKCNQMTNLIANIRIHTEQLVQEKSIQRYEFDQLLQNLDERIADLEGLGAIMSR